MDQEKMTHICVKCGAMIKFFKDKTKGVWLTTRVIVRCKKCAYSTQNQLIAAEKSYAKEDSNELKV